jgi:predicted RNA binding protein YcfA (HicA-like mRNA interferase family)
MKLPRDIDARQLVKALAKFGYVVTRQSGSHIRLTCAAPTPHSLTVPNHSPLKPGTLNAIPSDVATHHRIEKSALVDALFG